MRQIRSYQTGDAPALAEIFHRAVREGASGVYSEAERAAWSPTMPRGDAWERRLACAETAVAEEGGRPVGFMTLDLQQGYLDLAFVLPEVMGQGVASSLYAVIESRARAAGLGRLTSEASLLAEPVFAARGWRVLRRQTVVRSGIEIANAIMEKELSTKEVAA
ncbi:MAG: GNAT family N-acetyltransferase [Silicimonas sp.]|nr:GNAT family N-acetyltransferase [Silicimonas sp.]